MSDSPRTAFFSYSHDSADHKSWVLRLATDIRTSGVDARLDRWHLRPGEEAGPFMARSVRDSRKIVVVCTDTYVTKAEGRLGGAGFESAMVTAELVADQGTAKFIPVLRDNPSGRIPDFLNGRIYVDFRTEDSYEDALTTLLRAIHDLPAVDPPPVGEANLSLLSRTKAPELVRPARSLSEEAKITIEELEELLQDPNRRIRLSKRLWSTADSARQKLQEDGLYSYAEPPTAESIARKVSLAEDATRELLPLLATMGRWATPQQIPAAAQIVSRFMDVPEPAGTFYEANQHLGRYPALLALYAIGIGALSAERLDNFRAVLFVGVPSPRRLDEDRPLVEALHSGAPFQQDVWRKMPGRERQHTPLSDHALENLVPTLPDYLGVGTVGERLFDRVESIVSLAYMEAKLDSDPTSDYIGARWAPLGSYLWRDQAIIQRMRDDLDRRGSEWPPLKAGFFAGAVDRATGALKMLAEHLMRVRDQKGIF